MKSQQNALPGNSQGFYGMSMQWTPVGIPVPMRFRPGDLDHIQPDCAGRKWPISLLLRDSHALDVPPSVTMLELPLHRMIPMPWTFRPA